MSELEYLRRIHTFLESPVGSLVSGAMVVVTGMVGVVLVIGDLL